MLSLTEDPLLVIMDLISPQDARSLMTVSRELLPIAKRRACSEIILADGVATTRDAIAAFTYMLEDVHDRLRWLRLLTVGASALHIADDYFVGFSHLSPFNFNPDVMKLLADILSTAPHLQGLSLEMLEMMLPLEPRLRSALLGLPNLTYLIMMDIGQHALEVLSQMRWSRHLHTLQLSRCDFDDANSPMLWTGLDVAHSQTSGDSIGSPHVQWLRLSVEKIHQPHAKTLLALVRNASPVVYSLKYGPYESLPASYWPQMGDSLPRLRCWQVTVSYVAQSTQMLVAFLESMAEFLASTRIVMIRVCVHDSLAHCQAWDTARVRPSLDRLANAVPSLRYLSLGISTPPSTFQVPDTVYVGKVWWWRVKEEITRGVRVLSAFETDAGERLFEHQCTPGWSFNSDHYTLLPTTQKGQHEQEVLPPNHYLCTAFIGDDRAIEELTTIL